MTVLIQFCVILMLVGFLFGLLGIAADGIQAWRNWKRERNWQRSLAVWVRMTGEET